MTNLNIAKLYLAANAGTTATALDAAIADTSANTAVQALTTAAFVEAAYQAAFGRAADAEGLAYWSDRIDNGGMAKDDAFMAALVVGAEVYVAPTAENPLVIGDQTFTAATTEGVNDVAVAANKASAEAAGVAAGTAVSTGTLVELIINVTEDAATVVAAKGTIDTAVTAASATDTEALLLTVAADIITGTSGDDSINAYIGQNTISGANVDTLTSIDIVDGGAGVDTLTAQASSATNGSTIANVENVIYTAFANHNLSLANTTGLESLTNKGSINALTVTAAANLIDLTVQNVNAQTTSLTYNAAAVAGLTDTQNLTLSNASNTAVVDLVSNAIETLAITSEGSANTVSLLNVDTITSMTIAGDQDLNAGFTKSATGTNVNVTNLKTVDASTATGNSTLDLATNVAASVMTVTTGTGDDKVTFTNMTKDDSIDLGAGNDTLVTSGFTSVTTAPTLTGVENIVFAAQTVVASLNASGATELETITITEDDGGADTVTVTKAAATTSTINFDTIDGTTDAATYNNVTLGLATTSGTSDELTLNFQNTNTNGLHVNVADDTTMTVATVTANGIETININTADMGVENDTTVLADAGIVITTLASDKLKTLTVTSDSLVTITNNLDDSINTIDASATTAGVSLQLDAVADADNTVAADKTLTVTTGSGADTIADILGTVTTSVTTGAGKDTISVDATAQTKILTIDSGADNDSIDLSLDNASAIAKNITLGDGVDTLTIGAGIDVGTLVANPNIALNIVVSDFVVGAGGDKIDFSAAAIAKLVNATSTTAYSELVMDIDNSLTNGTQALVGGITVVTSDTGTFAASLSAADAAAYLASTTGNAADILSSHATTDVSFLVIGDGSDTGIYALEGADGADTAIDAAELTLIVTLTGVSDASKLTVDNFTDFLA